MGQHIDITAELTYDSKNSYFKAIGLLTEGNWIKDGQLFSTQDELADPLNPYPFSGCTITLPATIYKNLGFYLGNHPEFFNGVQDGYYNEMATENGLQIIIRHFKNGKATETIFDEDDVLKSNLFPTWEQQQKDVFLMDAEDWALNYFPDDQETGEEVYYSERERLFALFY
ncbi:MAG: hypothetical protein GW898_10630 [Thiomicrospira sp.]|nr:hypothetical protein [Thiomicrospira sp.]NCO14812.1 hypothetical protein [Thiomicrospira sp.]NCO82408.1 hypothetical protein [Thiomicrospira sp.]OIP95463.1 MAG: hypothetical protein AUK56_05330 [Thiomicrospira sp. CG2_30_44_34]